MSFVVSKYDFVGYTDSMQEDPYQPSETQIEYPEQPRPKPVKKSTGLLKSFLSIFEFFATVSILVFIILGFGLQSYHVVGSSMVPTLHEKDRLLISKLGRTVSRVKKADFLPERGEIIVFKSPTENGLQLVKRVVALPGERVLLENGRFTVFNDQNPEGFNPDIQYDPDSDFAYTTGTVDVDVPEGEIFVTGDNRTPGGSLDSRNSLGTVPLENIVGKLILRILPIGQARSF